MKNNLFRIFKLFYFVVLSIFLESCSSTSRAPAYDPFSLATEIGISEKRGKLMFASACSFTYVDFGSRSASFQSGLCANFEHIFLFRTIDVNDPRIGNSRGFPHGIIRSVSITKPNLFGSKQFQFRTDNGIVAIFFRNDNGFGLNSENNEVMANYLTNQHIQYLPDTEMIEYAAVGNTTVYSPIIIKK